MLQFRVAFRCIENNVGDKLRRYEKMDVASYLVCNVLGVHEA